MPDTETRNPGYVDIDRWDTREAVEAMFEGQLAAIASIAGQTSVIAGAADAAAKRLGSTGRLIYAGAGTSGRIAVQDGVELGPTFNWPADRLIYLMAGGLEAMIASAEGAEDDDAEARRLVLAYKIKPADVVIGIAASGRTAFTVEAIKAARSSGALTIGIANNSATPLLDAAEYAISALTGAEIIAGSTRMKAGTAQKAIANMLSTAIMLRLGRVYRGLMVEMVVSNDKLLRRAHEIVTALTGCSDRDAIAAVEGAGHDIKLAVLMALGQSRSEAVAILARNGGILRQAVEMLEGASD